MLLPQAQCAEAWEALGPWIEEAKPDFGPGIKERFEFSSQVTSEQVVPSARLASARKAGVSLLSGSVMIQGAAMCSPFPVA